jgi:hypothetical protein
MGSPGSNGKDQEQRSVPANGDEEAPDVFLSERQFPTPEAKYQHQRAQAEERFRMDFALWETANRENPPRSVSLSVSAAGEVRTERRNDLDLVLSLENYIQQFLFAALYAYGDLLLDKLTPPTEAVREFEQHADELLQETFNRKWLFGLRRLELLEAEFAERYWPMQRDVVEEARYEFEEDVWSTDDAPAEESGPAQPCQVEPAACPEPASPEHTPKDPPRKRGPKPDRETALLVATIVARVAPEGDWRSRVDDVCDALDDEQVPVPATWRRNRNVRKWSLCDDRDIVVKAIEYRLGIAKQQKKPAPETLS